MNTASYSIIGRYCDTGKTVWMTMSACTVAFTVKGASFCSLRLAGDENAVNSEKKDHVAWYEVELDGKTVIRAAMDEAERTVKVFDQDNGAEHTVRLVKLSESTSSILGFRGIETDGITAPVGEKEKKLVVIGDSITCGYGVEGELGQVFMTATENATKAYGFLTAKALDADVQLVSFSGFGIISGWTDTGAINEECLVPDYYEKTGLNDSLLEDGLHAQDHDWDFSRFKPDWIVINLGTNDQSYCKTDEVKQEGYRTKYRAFLKKVRSHDPQARILCILGVMGTQLNEKMLAAVEDYKAESGDSLIRALSLQEQQAETDGLGTDSHPSAQTQIKLAATVTEALRQWDAEDAE